MAATGSVNAITVKPLPDNASLNRYARSGSSSTMAMKWRNQAQNDVNFSDGLSDNLLRPPSE